MKVTLLTIAPLLLFCKVSADNLGVQINNLIFDTRDRQHWFATSYKEPTSENTKAVCKDASNLITIEATQVKELTKYLADNSVVNPSCEDVILTYADYTELSVTYKQGLAKLACNAFYTPAYVTATQESLTTLQSNVSTFGFAFVKACPSCQANILASTGDLVGQIVATKAAFAAPCSAASDRDVETDDL